MGKYTDKLIFAGGKMIYGDTLNEENKITFKEEIDANGEKCLTIISKVTIRLDNYKKVITTEESYNSNDTTIEEINNLILLPAVRDISTNPFSFVSKYEQAKFTITYNSATESILNLQFRITDVIKTDHPSKTDHPENILG